MPALQLLKAWCIVSATAAAGPAHASGCEPATGWVSGLVSGRTIEHKGHVSDRPGWPDQRSHAALSHIHKPAQPHVPWHRAGRQRRSFLQRGLPPPGCALLAPWLPKRSMYQLRLDSPENPGHLILALRTGSWQHTCWTRSGAA